MSHSQLSTFNSQLIPAGYKQTEAGVIPEDWEVKSLGTFVGLQRGHDLTERDRRPGEVPVMGSAGPNGFHDTALVCGPGVVLGRSGASFGRAHYCKTDFWPHNTALYITDFFGNHPLFAFYFLKAIDFSRHNSGGAQQSLNRNFIAPIQIAVPKRDEQEAIAEALSDADALIESLEQLLAKKRQVKQGAMQELLTGKKRLPGFEIKPGYKQSEVGLIPNDWNQYTIRDIATKVGSGVTPTGGIRRYKEFGRPFVRSQNVGWGSLLLDDLAFIDEETHSAFPATELKKHDVLLNITGASIGRTTLADDRLVGGNVNQHVCIIRLDASKAIPKFINLFLLSSLGQRQIDSFQAGGNRQGLNFSQINSLKIPLPPTKAEQTAIAAVLSDMDAEIAALETKLAKARQLKQGMMQELLTGRIRLV
ncbi:MAG: restriction endonuclease subunit S [Nitrospira sp. CR2.1]|nr:restriction endonuclease subunit S [Nitrospira sp. CR2.1]MBA5873118.1 restriction endonuclease subunit S [Nitrospira sp. CR1.2]